MHRLELGAICFDALEALLESLNHCLSLLVTLSGFGQLCACSIKFLAQLLCLTTFIFALHSEHDFDA